MAELTATKYATKDALLKASDLTERDVELPLVNMTVKVRALPAAYSNQAASEALVSKQIGRDQITTVDKAKMEAIQALHGLVEPKLETIKEAEQMAMNLGPSWARIIEVIDEISGVDKEAVEKAQARFQDSGKGEAGVALGDAGANGEGSD